MGHVKDRWYTKDKRPTARHGKGKRWQCWYQVDGKETCGGSFAKKSDAENKLTELEASVLRGAWVDPTDTTTVSEWVRRHAFNKILKPRTVKRIESYIKNHIEPTPLGARRVGKVKPSEAQTWVTDRSKHGLAPSTVRSLVTLVRGAYAAAVLDHLTTENPFARVTLPPMVSERIVPLTVKQVMAVVSVVAEKYKAMVITQAGLGLRLGELLALRVEDVDFLRREVSIVYQVDLDTRELVSLKTSLSKRTMPLPDVVAVALAEHIRKFPPSRDGLLFHTEAGRPYRHNWINSRIFVPAALKAGLPKGTTTHDLRHHYASVLLAAGESVVAVAARLGDGAEMVLNVYGHLLPNLEDRTRKAVDSAWNAVTDDSRELVTAHGRPR